jgi:putative ABC transport system permease protein
MKSLSLVWAAFVRRKGRTLFTWLSVVVAFILFSVLAAVRFGMLGQLQFSAADRLDTNNKAEPGGSMPLSYYPRIASVPGVVAASYLNGLAGYFRRRQNMLRVLAASPSIFQVFPEAKFPRGELRAWRSDQQGAIVGPALASRYGWKIGESIPIRTRVLRKDGNTTWYFHLDGIYHADLPSAYQSFFIAHYRYYNQAVADGRLRNRVAQYTERIADPRAATRVCRAIDALFAHSSPQTLTQSEVQETISFIRQFGDVSAIVIYVGIAVFFSLLLIIGNTVAQSVRERMGEFAVFRAIGFPGLWIVRLLFKETLLLLLSGSAVGLALGWWITRALYPSVGNVLQTFQLTWSAVIVGVLLSALFAVGAAILPARRIARLEVAQALRGA